ncbi:MAG: hypothetical protein QMD43_05380 [Thermodesulfovibrio sp.]|uniref:hypothetical protein n=2 Tax=unclassified Thermodesulfovibrio TaxID=2645936 RepID=UPI002482BEF1|nr:hypothetical protein [Thermodesulfovibrio sp. 1176]MDI1472521.1 hypothetical protein [Thermodesulfovibrio sp. 1176]MDI6714442.1 hypothetical protein [Thermodesulfovibrio sp.]
MREKLLFLTLFVFLTIIFFSKASFCEIKPSIPPSKVTPAPKQLDEKSKQQQPSPSPSQMVPSSPHFLSIQSFTASSSVINYGDDLNLRWVIKGKNLGNLRLEIKPDIGQIPLTRTDYFNESFTIEGSKTIKPLQDTKYTLEISAPDPFRLDIDPRTGRVLQRSLIASKELFITVKKPKIENVKPSVDQKTMKIKFFAKNTGNGDFLSSPIEVKYSIITSLTGPSLAEGSFTTSNLTIRVSEQVELGNITLPDRTKALNADSLLINVILNPKYRAHLPQDVDYYEHAWERNRLIINNQLISIFGSLLTGSIRLNNFDGSTGILSHNPYKANDSHIEIMGNRTTFSIPRFDYSKGEIYDYRGFVNDINASFSGQSAFAIEDGKIKLKINFETSGTEIRGYEYTWGVWHDVSAPDYNFTQMDITVYFIPAFKNGKITYKDIQVIPYIRGTFVEAWDAFLSERLERDIDNKIKNVIASKLKEILMSESVRVRIENKIEEAITKNPLFNIFRITNVIGEGENIIIEYISK